MLPLELSGPALIVLVGPSGAGKSFWAAANHRSGEVISSDALRAVLGTGEADLDASAEAFEVLEQIVAARLRRGLMTVIDTLGLDRARRQGWLRQASNSGLAPVAVVFDTSAALCRERNARRDRPVPARILTAQLRRTSSIGTELAEEGWTVVVLTDPTDAGSTPEAVARPAGLEADDRLDRPLDVVLQISRFPWGEDPARWLREIALAADAVGVAGIALMDHLIQIPQVGRAWEPIPEPWVALGLLAGLDTRLRLGTLVSPVTFRPAGITAKAAATLDVLAGGRGFLGLGAGWWQREHAGFGLDFPSPAERLDRLEQAIETIRALWAPGTKPFAGERVTLPETTCYPRPIGAIPIIVGGSGERRTLRIAAALADGCNLPADPERLDRGIAVLHRHCADLGRDPAEVSITVLDVPILGRDAEDVARRVERLRGRTPAPVFAARHHAGPVERHQRRYRTLAERGVRTVFCALPDLTGPEDLDRLRPLTDLG